MCGNSPRKERGSADALAPHLYLGTPTRRQGYQCHPRISRSRPRVLLDVFDAPLLAAARAGADILKPNAQELLEATGATTLTDAIRTIRALGARLVVVSRGTDGIVAADTHGQYEVDAVSGVNGNPTGAGDAATAGLAGALLRGLPVLESLSWAAALGAAAVLRPVAGKVDLAVFHRFLTNEKLMTIATLPSLLDTNRGVGAFNVVLLEHAEAIIEGAERAGTPAHTHRSAA